MVEGHRVAAVARARLRLRPAQVVGGFPLSAHLGLGPGPAEAQLRVNISS